MDTLALMLTAPCATVRRVSVTRVVDAATRRVPLQRRVGAGLTLSQFRHATTEGRVRHVGLVESAHLIASGLGWKLDRVDETIEPAIAPRDLDSAYVRVPAGCAAGIKQYARGYCRGELAISAYAMVRYINQNDDDQVFTDHLGNERSVDPRTDVFSHRTMVFLKGWMVSPKLVYTITLWEVNATNQNAIFANLGYQFSRHFSLYAGMTGNPGSRSLLGSHPFWLAHDRVMADEFFRPYFANGIYAVGEVVPGLWYNATLSNNNSGLGVKASQLDRKFTSGGSLWWMPTTNEFGPRGAYGDWEMHDKVATRFGVGYVDSPEQSFRSSEGGSPENTSLRLADSVNVFETGALAPGVTVENADYRVLSVDAGVKYKGFFLQAEYYQRWLGGFAADGPLPVREIVDTGFYVQAAFFPIPRTLEVYGVTSQIFGDKDAGFDNSYEYGLGMNWYPFDTRNHRLNAQVLDVHKSPVSSTFGYYTGGMDGISAATSFSIFF
jgi:hypothetical protein